MGPPRRGNIMSEKPCTAVKVVGVMTLFAGTLELLWGLLFFVPAVTGMEPSKFLVWELGYAGCVTVLIAVVLWWLGMLVAGIGVIASGSWARIFTLVLSALGLL